jgi:hypothetical protein
VQGGLAEPGRLGAGEEHGATLPMSDVVGPSPRRDARRPRPAHRDERQEHRPATIAMSATLKDAIAGALAADDALQLGDAVGSGGPGAGEGDPGEAGTARRFLRPGIDNRASKSSPISEASMGPQPRREPLDGSPPRQARSGRSCSPARRTPPRRRTGGARARHGAIAARRRCQSPHQTGEPGSRTGARRSPRPARASEGQHTSIDGGGRLRARTGSRCTRRSRGPPSRRSNRRRRPRGRRRSWRRPGSRTTSGCPPRRL